MPANGRNKFFPPSLLPSSSFLPRLPLLISMFRMWFTCIKGCLWRGPRCIVGPRLVITVKAVRVSLRFHTLKPFSGCIQNANKRHRYTLERLYGADGCLKKVSVQRGCSDLPFDPLSSKLWDLVYDAHIWCRWGQTQTKVKGHYE